jgi:hypothetical protein
VQQGVEAGDAVEVEADERWRRRWLPRSGTLGRRWRRRRAP